MPWGLTVSLQEGLYKYGKEILARTGGGVRTAEPKCFQNESKGVLHETRPGITLWRMGADPDALRVRTGWG